MQTFKNDMLRIPLSIKRLAQLETFVYHMPDDVQLEESLIFIKAHFRPLFPLLASPLLASPRPSSRRFTFFFVVAFFQIEKSV